MLDDHTTFSLKDPFSPLTNKKAIIWIIIIGSIVYFNALFGQFVWDDKPYVLLNSQFYGLNLIDLFSHNVFNSYGFYRPIPAIYFSVLYHLFDNNYFFYHLPQIILHIANSILFFLLLKRFINKSFAFLMALIFLVHPIQVESVAFIAQSTSVILFFFGISVLGLFHQKTLSNKKIMLIALLLLLGMLTKESFIIFIFLILLSFFIFKKAFLIKFSVIILGILGSYAAIRFFIGDVYFYKMEFVPISLLDFPSRLINIPSIIFYYIKTFVFPLNLAISQNWIITEITFNNFFIPIIFVSVFFIFIFWRGIILRNNENFNAYIFFSLWFIVSLSLHIQIFPLNMTVADRWFYIPIAGLLGIIGVNLDFFIRKKSIKTLTYFFLVIVILMLSFRTVFRIADWNNPIGLYTHDIKISNDYNKEAHLGWELLTLGKLDEALIHYKKSLEFLPYETIYNQIGYVYERKGDHDSAREHYLEAMKAKTIAEPPLKHSEGTYINLARHALYFDKDAEITREHSKSGLDEFPINIKLLVLLALSEYQLGNYESSLMAIELAYNHNSSDPVLEVLAIQIRNKELKELPPVTIFY